MTPEPPCRTRDQANLTLLAGTWGSVVGRQHAPANLVEFDALEQGLEVALAEALVALALDQLEEDRADLVLGEDLQQQALAFGGGAVDDTGLLLQIFTQNAIGPIFFELIQRKGNEGFGEGNFQALFESIELDQIRRGVLPAKAS